MLYSVNLLHSAATTTKAFFCARFRPVPIWSDSGFDGLSGPRRTGLGHLSRLRLLYPCRAAATVSRGDSPALNAPSFRAVDLLVAASPAHLPPSSRRL